MKKTFLIIFAMVFFVACVDKKAEEEKKAAEATELNEKMEAIDKEIDEDFESLEKEAQELDNAINELDNL